MTSMYQCTNVRESELPNVPNLDFLVSKIGLGISNDSGYSFLCMILFSK